MNAELTGTRILQNPLGAIAPPGHPGDLVKISDGRTSLHELLGRSSPMGSAADYSRFPLVQWR